MTQTQGLIVENVAQRLHQGQKVYDAQAEKVGQIEEIDTEKGWFRAAASPAYEKSLYLPFRLVTSLDPQEVFVGRTREELLREYSSPPPREILVEEVDGRTTAVTSQASGYDGSSIEFRRVDVDAVKKFIMQGYEVLTWDKVGLGNIKRYDSTTGWMLIEQVVPHQELVLPVTTVERVDPQLTQVYLVLSRGDIQRMKHLEPVDVIFVGVTSASSS